MSKQQAYEVVVIGGGPGGYGAAFMAADLGLEVALVDPEANPGGVCLYRGCIPSKALLHLVKVKQEALEAEAWGLQFSEPKLHIDKIRQWKNKVVEKLTGGLGTLTKKRKITYIRGMVKFTDAHTLEMVEGDDKGGNIKFQHAILATGSEPVEVPGLSFDHHHIINSADALNLEQVPETLLVVGAGYIGLEIGTIYAGLGSNVSLVEMTDGLMPGADRDLVDVFSKRNKGLFETVMFETKVTEAQVKKKQVRVKFEGKHADKGKESYEQVLVAVGRKPRTQNLGLENTKVKIDDTGFVQVNAQRRTAEPSIYAIGDIAGEPMLAHKATHEGKVAAEAIAGHKTAYEPQAIPAVVFTNPEIAWCGLTETEAEAQDRKIKVVKFPWVASGRATTLGRNDGLTKLIIEPDTERILGVAIVGTSAGDLIPEGVLAVEMAATAKDFALTIHPHPTLSETLMEAAEALYGQSTHIFSK